MNKMRTMLVLWLCSVAVAVIAVERWRRVGNHSIAATANFAEPSDTDGDDTPVQASTAKPKVSTSIVAGAISDYDRARHLLQRALPGQSTSAPSATDTAVSDAATTVAGLSEVNVGSLVES